MYLFEGSLGEQMTFDPGQSLVGIVVRLLNQAQLFSLTLVQTGLHTRQKKVYQIRQRH